MMGDKDVAPALKAMAWNSSTRPAWSHFQIDVGPPVLLRALQVFGRPLCARGAV
jgi:hypothetical protein